MADISLAYYINLISVLIRVVNLNCGYNISKSGIERDSIGWVIGIGVLKNVKCFIILEAWVLMGYEFSDWL